MDLEVVDALKSAGVPEDKARAVVVSLHREIDQRYALHAAQLATRGDLAEVKGELKGELSEVKREIVAATARVEAKLAETKADLLTRLAQTKAELVRWSVGSFIAMAGVFAAIARLMPH
jgi:hypothetical protein